MIDRAQLRESLHVDCDCGHDRLSLDFHFQCAFTKVRAVAYEILNAPRIKWCKVHEGPDDHTGYEPCEFVSALLVEVDE